MEDINLLKQFLEFPIWTSKPVFDKFRTIEGAIFREENENGKKRFLFVNGKRDNKVVLVAHADTYFDEFYNEQRQEHSVEEEKECFIGKSPDGSRVAIGADDRAGCAILWALRESGHSLLLVDGEEHWHLINGEGQIGSKWLMNENLDIANIINNHQFMIEFDRKNAKDFKCYEVGTIEFSNYIKNQTKYIEEYGSGKTDIGNLCKNICGVNLSVGYNNEHHKSEYINITQWLNTLNVARSLIDSELPKFNRL